MSSEARRQGGFTLVEMIVAIVIIGVGLAGVLVAFTTTTRGSGDGLVRRQLLGIAEGLMEEALSRPYAAAAGGGSANCERSAFNDLDDYNGYATTGRICSIDGSEIGNLAGVSRQRVNRSLKLLEDAGFLRIEYGGIAILDLEGLRQFGG